MPRATPAAAMREWRGTAQAWFLILFLALLAIRVHHQRPAAAAQRRADVVGRVPRQCAPRAAFPALAAHPMTHLAADSHSSAVTSIRISAPPSL